MADLKKVEEYIWNITNIWRDAGMDGTQYVASTLYIMCLKKMVEMGKVLFPDRFTDND